MQYLNNHFLIKKCNHFSGIIIIFVVLLMFSSCNKKSPTEPEPIFSVSPTNLLIEVNSESTGTFDVSSNINNWVVISSVEWLTVTPTTGSLNGTVIVTATNSNPSSSSRIASITVQGTGVNNLNVIVKQEGVGADTLTGNNGNVYQTVKIGNQRWMAENLKETHYHNGDLIPKITDNTEWANLISGAYCAYDNDELISNTYGYLYNWYVINDNRNIAPEGWHVPTDEEWKELEIYLGMSQEEANAQYPRGTDEGGKLKETGNTHWTGSNYGATNESNFTALPGGFREDGIFNGLEYGAYFWTSTDIPYEDFFQYDYAWYRGLHHYISSVSRYTGNKQNGFSIRLIRD